MPRIPQLLHQKCEKRKKIVYKKESKRRHAMNQITRDFLERWFRLSSNWQNETEKEWKGLRKRKHGTWTLTKKKKVNEKCWLYYFLGKRNGRKSDEWYVIKIFFRKWKNDVWDM